MRTDEIIYSPYPLGSKYLLLVQTEPVAEMRQSLSYSLVYNLYIGNNTKRIFSPSSLPSFIQSKLAMINSIAKDDWKTKQYEDYLLEVDCYAHRKHLNKHPEFKHIGWQVSDSIYVIVLDEDELTQLKGTTVDTRKESQIKSQANS